MGKLKFISRIVVLVALGIAIAGNVHLFLGNQKMSESQAEVEAQTASQISSLTEENTTLAEENSMLSEENKSLSNELKKTKDESGEDTKQKPVEDTKQEPEIAQIKLPEPLEVSNDPDNPQYDGDGNNIPDYLDNIIELVVWERNGRAYDPNVYKPPADWTDTTPPVDTN